MRHLATIQTIAAIHPIPKADNLEVATVLGWSVVVRKDENLKPGDKVVFFEIDSFLPVDDPRFEFLRKSCFRETTWQGSGFRIKTAKLRGQISQGLVVPVAKFPEIPPEALAQDGHDVTELLRVDKWDPTKGGTLQSSGLPRPGMVGTIISDSKPDGIPTTDEIRLQTIPGILEHFVGKPYYVTQKLDGTSVTVYVKDGKVGACSRRCEVSVDEVGPLTKVMRQHNLFELLPTLPERFPLMNVAVQGEFCGPGIQKNRLELREMAWFVFDIFDLDQDRYLDLPDMVAVCDFLGLRRVPLVEQGERFPAEYTLDALLKKAETSEYGPGRPAEGIVVRTQQSLALGAEDGWDACAARGSFKVLNNKFLLKYDE